MSSLDIRGKASSKVGLGSVRLGGMWYGMVGQNKACSNVCSGLARSVLLR